MTDAGADADLQQRAERVVQELLARDAFSRWLGIEVLELAPARCRCRLRVREQMVNGFGVAHGAVVYALADTAVAFAGNSGGTVTLSVENTVGYTAPAKPGDVLEALATEESAGRKVGFYAARVTNQRGEVVALFRGTMYRTSTEHPA